MYVKGRGCLVKIADLKSNFIMLKSNEKLKDRHLQEKRTVNLLPSLDPYLMSYKERERYIHDEHYDKVFDRSGNVTSTILLDVRVVGVWDFAEDVKSSVNIFLFEDVEGSTLGKICSEARRIGRFLAAKEST